MILEVRYLFNGIPKKEEIKANDILQAADIFKKEKGKYIYKEITFLSIEEKQTH